LKLGRELTEQGRIGREAKPAAGGRQRSEILLGEEPGISHSGAAGLANTGHRVRHRSAGLDLVAKHRRE